MKKKLQALLAKKEARKAELGTKANATEDVKELRSINSEIDSLNIEMTELRGMIDAMPDENENPANEARKKDTGNEEEEFRSDKLNSKTENRGVVPQGGLNPLGTYSAGNGSSEARAKELKEASEKRGKDLKENRSVTVGSSNVILPQYQGTEINPTFNEVSSLLDRVSTKTLIGGESYKQPYVTGYGEGAETEEGADYNDAEATFGSAAINKSKITAYAEDTEELQKLPAADYDGEVMKGVTIATRKRITRQILVGSGAAERLTGIFSAAATAIDASTDLPITEIDESTLDEIVYSFGGDEDVEDAAVLILNKKDLKAFAMLRDSDGNKIHKVTTKGNTGDIDGIPFIINSACKAISDPATTTGQYGMAYGPLSNYLLTIFSDIEVSRSTDYKFKQGMIAHKAVVFAGGNVVSKNGFLRVKKG